MQQNVIEGFRLSPQQKRLWTLQHAAPSVYCVQGAVQIAGPLDATALSAAVQQVIERHEILRTRFQCLPGMNIPVQVIVEEPVHTLARHDLSAATAQEQTTGIAALLAELRQPARSENDSPLRLALVALAPQQQMLLISLPALCGDPATLRNIVREIYAAYTADPQIELSAEPMQYADFAEWQHNLLEEESEESSGAYWRDLDLSALRAFKLPLEQATDESQFAPQAVPVALQPESAARLVAFAQQHDTSVSLSLLAAYYALLWRLTHQPEIVVGVGYDGRAYEDLQDALGLFAKYVPVRAQLDPGASFRTLLVQVAQAVGEAADGQDYFFWERFEPVRGTGAPPFFPATFEFEELPATYAAGDTSFALARVESCTDRFNVKLACVSREEALSVTLQYDAARFTAATIERMAQMFQMLLEQALAQPDQPIAALPLLSADERQRLLHAFNATQAHYPTGQCFHELFAQQAARTPDNVAVSFADQRLSYAELHARSNQLARQLRKLGLQPEDRVAIYLERSLDLLVAILGVFKAGGVYLPLDPTFPQTHLAMILSDSQARVVLTQEPLSTRLPEHTATLVCIDRDWPTIAQESTDNPGVEIAPNSAAYVIYTSGSTGQPKGVVVEHQSLVNYLCWVNDHLLGDQACHLPVVTRLTFDASLKQLFAPLLRGAEVWLLPDEIVNEPEALLHTLATRDNVALNCVPSLWTTLLDMASEQHLAQLNQQLTHLFVGGEQLSPELVARSFAALPRLQLWNLYGPTETTANASAARITAADAITIGGPVANSQVYLLDAYLQPVPIGVVGDLYVGGLSVARGYLNRPAATAERFIPDPFSAGTNPGARLYHTGDLARYRADGTLEFLGRSDYQIKLRGLRIELGAIEAALNRHPSVRESVVVVRDDNLVAYIVEEPSEEPRTKSQEPRTKNQEPSTKNRAQAENQAESGTAGPDSTDLRSFLQTQLPGYMIPAMIVALDAFPLKSNGKLDRSALPAPSAARSVRAEAFVAPRDALEEALAAIWCEVLDLDQVGVHDNFFSLGGHSLLATRLVSRLRKVFRVELPLRALFEVTTIAELSQALVARETRPGQVAKIAELLKQIKTMSAEEVSETIENKRPASGQ